MPVKITLKPVDQKTADNIILNYVDNKNYKILYKYIGNKTYYWFTTKNIKHYAGYYNTTNQTLKYKAL